MLSVDNYAHDGAGTQGYRYTYANNNPLKYTDPDGEVPFFIIPNVGWSSSGGLSIGLEFGIGVPGLLSASVTVGYSFGSKQLSASIQGGAVGFYAGYGTGGAFAGFGFNHGGVNLGAGVSYAGDGNWDFNGGVSLGGSSGNYNGSIGVGWSLSSGFGANVGAGYTHRFEIRRQKVKVPEFIPNNKGGVQSYKDGPGDPPSYTIVSSGFNLSWSLGFSGADYGVGTASDGNDFALYFSATQKDQWFNVGGDASISVSGLVSTNGMPLTLDGSFSGESQKVFYSGGVLGKGSASILSNPGKFGEIYSGLEIGAGPGQYVLPYSFGYGRTKTWIWTIPRFSTPTPYKMSPINKYTNPFYGPKF